MSCHTPRPYFLAAAFTAAALDLALALDFDFGTALPSVSRFGFGAFGANFLANTHVHAETCNMPHTKLQR